MLIKFTGGVEHDIAFCFFVVVFLELTATGARGSSGENALLPAEVARGHASVFVITRPPVTVVDHVREIRRNSPGVTRNPAQVGFFSNLCEYKFSPQNIPSSLFF